MIALSDRIKALLRDSPLPVTLADPAAGDAPLVFANPAFERLTGYSVALEGGKGSTSARKS